MNDLQREVAPDVVDDVPFGVDDFAKGTVVFVDWLVVFVVVGTAGHEIGDGLLFFHSLVVGRAQLDLVDVGNQDGLVVTDRFDKNVLDVVLSLLEGRRDVFAAFLGGIGRVEGGHPRPVLRHVFYQIGQGRVAGDLSLGDRCDVFGVVKGGRLLGTAELPAVVPDVEDLGGNVVEKRQEPADALGDVGLSGRRQADHDDDELVGCGVSHHLEGRRVFSLRQHVREGVVFRRPGVPGVATVVFPLFGAAVGRGVARLCCCHCC
mmetsp:Transcript_16372/g.33629  ORF Transcript_16372/g.33629 Transcript_16372/m.33629 type:complete len:262 (+) Transcript_16372:1520-2305(+)